MRGTITVNRDRRDRRRPRSAPHRDRDGRQRALGPAARAQADRGSRGGRGGALRHGRGRPRARAAVDDGLRVLDRELAPADRRGPVPHAVQRVAAAAAPRRPERARRAGAVHRSSRRARARSGCCATSRTPRRSPRANRRMTLTFAFNYGGRAELTDAVQRDRRGGGGRAGSSPTRSPTRRSPATSTRRTCRTPTSWSGRRGSSGSRTTCSGRARTPSSSSPTSSGPTSGASTSSTRCASSSDRDRRFGAVDT